MAVEGCPLANNGCPYWEQPAPKELEGLQEHGCYSDRDHIVPRRLATTALSRVYINRLPENRQQLCRDEHDQKDGEELPDIDFMREAVSTAHKEGQIRLSRNQQKRIFGYEL